jgi:hypothetical protein
VSIYFLYYYTHLVNVNIHHCCNSMTIYKSVNSNNVNNQDSTVTSINLVKSLTILFFLHIFKSLYCVVWKENLYLSTTLLHIISTKRTITYHLKSARTEMNIIYSDRNSGHCFEQAKMKRRKVWRYQRCNQRAYTKDRQYNDQRKTNKGTNNDQQNTTRKIYLKIE